VGFVLDNRDCNDQDSAVFPGASTCSGDELLALPHTQDFLFCGLSVVRQGNFAFDVCCVHNASDATCTLNAFKLIGGIWFFFDSFYVPDSFIATTSLKYISGKTFIDLAVDNRTVAFVYFNTSADKKLLVLDFDPFSGFSTVTVNDQPYATGLVASSGGVAARGTIIAAGGLNAVYVFGESPPGTWSLIQFIPAPANVTHFGDAIALSDDRMIVGAPSDDDDPAVSGVFIYFNNGSFFLESSLIYATEKGLGFAVAIDDGNGYVSKYIFVANITIYDTAANVSVLDFNSTILQTLSTADAGFGFSLSVHSNAMLVGAPVASRVVKYTRPTSNSTDTWVFSTNIDWDPDEKAGFDVSIDAGNFAVGTFGEEPFSEFGTGDTFVNFCNSVLVC
jgi:hypothetical protein